MSRALRWGLCSRTQRAAVRGTGTPEARGGAAQEAPSSRVRVPSTPPVAKSRKSGATARHPAGPIPPRPRPHMITREIG